MIVHFRIGDDVALYCAYMHMYGFVRAYTYVYKTAEPWNLMLSGNASHQSRTPHTSPQRTEYWQK